MSVISRRSIAAILACWGASTVHAASLFAGNAFYSIAPYTQMGPSVNFLAINQLQTGFMVAGQMQVTIAPGQVSGFLLKYQVKRLLNPTFGSQWLYLQHYIVGFSQPPGGGTFGLTTGFCKTYLDFSGQAANTPLTLVNGAATWNINQTGNYFNYVSGTDVYLVQDFELDGNQISGPGGTWIVDLPVTSEMVPEPASLTTLGLGLLAVRRRSRQKGICRL